MDGERTTTGTTPTHAGSPDDPARGLRRLAVVAVGATLALIALGGAVRATDSGLACPDWPACHGRWIPPVDLNIWLEHSHRLWAGVVMFLIAWLAGWTVLRHRRRPLLPTLALVAALLVLIQAALGAAVVLLHLRAGLVTAHLGMSLIVVGCLTVLAVATRAPDPGPRPSGPLSRRTARWWGLAAGLVFAQALLGGQATGRGAAYVFNAVPIWAAADRWTGHAREILHVSHRFAGYAVAVVVLAVATVAWWRQGHGDRQGPTRWLPPATAVLVLVQVGLGVTNVLTEAAVASAVAHLAVASWLWTAVVVGAAFPLVAPRSVPPGRDDDQSMRSRRTIVQL